MLTAEDIRRAFLWSAKRHASMPVPLLESLSEEDVAEQVEIYRDENLRIVEYAPKVFHAIRDLCGVRSASFEKEWEGDEQTYQEAGGRSLATFLRSQSKRYLAKSISTTEVDAILAVALDLAEYWGDHSSSLMMRLLGLVRIEMIDRRDVGYLICATDVLVKADVVHELFDLKGRKPKPPKPEEHVADMYRVMKDKHLMVPFALPTVEQRAHLLSRIRRDIEFLRIHGSMDYSVLVGVTRRTNENVVPPSRRCSVVPLPVERGALATAEVTDVHRVEGCGDVAEYHIGVIDLFTPYNSKKRLAHAMKATLWEKDTLSTIPPDEYAARLLAFCESRFAVE